MTLADVYQVIAHYLNHTAEIDAYLAQRQTEAAAVQHEIEKRFDPVGVRARLLARRTAEYVDRSPMLRLLADENFDHDLVRGVMRRRELKLRIASRSRSSSERSRGPCRM
ncbi:MAG: hypothetical protein QOF42_3311 [Gammaproteobacteria bacterium]|nr:hypothetical protein [Gammaproteobacteria bacterium]